MRFFILLLSIPSLLLAQGDSASRETALRKLLQDRCFDCHHPNTSDEPPYLHESIRLEELIDGDMVKKGDPAASALFRRVTLATEDRKRMPRSRGAGGAPDYREPLTAAEVKVVEDWIAGLGDSSSAPAPTTEAPTLVVASAPESAHGFLADRPLEEQIHWIFDEHCAKCHGTGPGAKNPELTGSTNLALLLAETRAVSAGLPENSLLLQVVKLPEDDPERPKSFRDQATLLKFAVRPPRAALESGFA